MPIFVEYGLKINGQNCIITYHFVVNNLSYQNLKIKFYKSLLWLIQTFEGLTF